MAQTLVKKNQFLFFISLLFTLSIQLASAQVLVSPTPAPDRLRSMEQRKELLKDSLLNSVSFRSIGPSIMSGRVVDVDANPEDPTEFYVAYATGGLWHTVNNGQSFTPIMDSLDVLVIGDIAVNWKSSPRLIWVGTGEVNSSRSSYAGTGVYQSSNNGKTWNYLGLPESHHIGDIELDPSNSQTAWVAVLGHLYSANEERGVYKTTDGGKTWQRSLFVNNGTGCVDLAMDSNNPSVVYAAMWQRSREAWKFEESGPSSGIYRTKDGGANWEKVSGTGSGFMEGTKIGRIGLTTFPGNSSLVYAVVDNNTPLPAKSKTEDSSYTKELFKEMSAMSFAALNDSKLDDFLRKNRFPRQHTASSVKKAVSEGTLKPTALWDYLDSDDGFQNTGIAGCEVYVSTDGGSKWKKANEKPISIFNTYGYYFAKIYTSHTNPDKVFILGFSSQVSTDGGKTFSSMDKENVHADHHALWVNPKKDSHLINGNDGGVNITYDDGKNWFKANTPSVGQYYFITTDDAKPYNVYGGLQDNGSWWGPSTHKESIGWTDDGQYAYRMINGGDGMQAQVDKRDNSTVYSGSQFGSYARYNKDKRGGGKFIRPQHELGEKPLRFNWQTPILLSRHQPDILYYGSNRLHRSLNKGDTLIALSSDLTGGGIKGNVPYGTLTAIEESPLRMGLLYTGSDDGKIYRSSDGGYTWTALHQQAVTTNKKKTSPTTTTGLDTKNLWVSRIVASQHKENRVYVTLNGYRHDHFNPYVFVSDDGGQTWKDIAGNLPLEAVNVIREDPTNPSILYVGTDGGVYVSWDGGQTYKGWYAGLPKSVPVHDIAIQQRENEIVIGTHGRSLYVGKLSAIQKPLQR
ncbi:MAG TPA: glycosyl hydrolase [Chitinophagaceae bacterium]|nr:glycosyl hydrolase [Chitinophagaceae bacterium]